MVKTAHVHGPDCGHDHSHDHDHEVGIACACGHDHAEDGAGEAGHSHSGLGLTIQLTVVLPLTIAALLLAYVIEWMQGANPVSTALGLFAAALAGGPIIWAAIKGLSRGHTNVNELVSLSIVGAVWLGMPLEAGLVALILQIGALIEGVATQSAREAVLALVKLAPRHARVRRTVDGVARDQVVEADALALGDVLVVQPGERIGADGVVQSGISSVDESLVTGESMPVDKTPGSLALAGTINLTGSMEIQIERVGAQSALGQTIELVKRAQAFQPAIIRAADRFFAFYTPIVLFASFIVLWVTGDPQRMVTMWVVGCPCAMLLASPLAIVVSLARASRSGIQVKAGPFVEASAELNTVVFDKTGTLTTGHFGVVAVECVEGVLSETLLKVASAIEQRSSHPLARAIVAYAAKQQAGQAQASDVRVLEGLGVEAMIESRPARAGSMKLLPPEAVEQAGRLDAAAAVRMGGGGKGAHEPVYIVLDGALLGAIYLADEIRPESSKTIGRLRALGIKRIIMLTGDRKPAAEAVGRAVGCDEVYSELRPGQKVDLVRQLQRGGKGVCMVGDGINDSPALAAASVGIAMGVRGTDVAINAADAVLLKDDLTRVPLLIYLAQQTRAAIYQNLAFAMVFTALVEGLVAFGAIPLLLKSMGMTASEAAGGTLIVAAVGHVLGVVVIAMNSVRLAGTGHQVGMRPRAVAPVAEPLLLTPALA
jgi:Cd2+/Zn2+-exporting ATPase